MDFSISALGASPMSYVAASPAASTDSSSGIDASSIGPAATLEISTLQLQSQMVSTLFTGLGGGNPSPVGRMIDALA